MAEEDTQNPLTEKSKELLQNALEIIIEAGIFERGSLDFLHIPSWENLSPTERLSGIGNALWSEVVDPNAREILTIISLCNTVTAHSENSEATGEEFLTSACLMRVQICDGSRPTSAIICPDDINVARLLNPIPPDKKISRSAFPIYPRLIRRRLYRF